MTRFARAEGSKSSNKKIPEDATPWSELKFGVKSNSHNIKSDSEESSKPEKKKGCKVFATGNSWSVIEENKNVNKTTKRKRELEGEDGVLFKKQKDTTNSAVIEKVKNQNNVSFEKNKGKLKKKNKCFACQEIGHLYVSCPNRKVGDICFICGSPEHRVKDCKQRKPDQTEYKFATCFICKEEGHLSSACPDNPRGIYPHGGSCRKCGEVTHLAKNCPQKFKEKKFDSVTVPTLGNDVEGLPEDNKPKVNKQVKKIKTVCF